MKAHIKKLLIYWEAKKQRKKEIDLFLKTYHLKLVKVKDTSLTLSCIQPVPSGKKNKYNLVREEDGFVIEKDLTLNEFTKKSEEYTKAAAKRKIPFEQYLDELVNLKRFGFERFTFAKRFDNHIEFGHIRVEVVNSNLPTTLPDGSKNPNFIAEAYQYVVGKGGRTSADILNNQSFRIKAWGGSHFLKNIDNVTVRLATPPNKLEQLTGNFGTFKLSTGEIVRKVQLEYFIKETNTWKLKKDPTTMWPRSWDIEKVKNIVKEATENVTDVKGRVFKGLTKDGYKVEFWINKQTKEIDTAYLVF